MATSLSLSYLRLDSSYDPIFVASASLTGVDAVAQSILTRLKLFLGEWWENLSVGLPVFQSMLGQLGSTAGLAAIQLAIQQNIEGAPFVTTVDSVAVNINSAGQVTVTVTAQTVFGIVNVTSLQGSSAQVGA